MDIEEIKNELNTKLDNAKFEKEKDDINFNLYQIESK